MSRKNKHHTVIGSLLFKLNTLSFICSLDWGFSFEFLYCVLLFGCSLWSADRFWLGHVVCLALCRRTVVVAETSSIVSIVSWCNPPPQKRKTPKHPCRTIIHSEPPHPSCRCMQRSFFLSFWAWFINACWTCTKKKKVIFIHINKKFFNNISS